MAQPAAKGWLRAAIAIAVTVAIVAALMLWRPSNLYPWLKAIHVIAVIAWMAGMLYLPRLFVYHCEAEPGSRQSETFKVMERRLLTVIINPAMVATWALGHLAGLGQWRLSRRLVPRQARAGARAFGRARIFRRAACAISPHDRNRRSQRFYRIINEVPTLLMIAIVILAVVKPF